MEYSKDALKKIAASQRTICLCILVILAMTLLGVKMGNNILTYAIYLAIDVFVILNVWNLCQALGMSQVISILLCILMLVPIVGLILLFVLNITATKALRQAGLSVGLLGVSKEDLDKL